MAIWQNYGNAAIRVLYPTLRDGVDYVWASAAEGDPPSLLAKGQFVDINLSAVQATANRLMGMNPDSAYDPNKPDPPQLSYIVPNSAAVGDPALTLEVHGSGFSDTSVIVWNNGDEATTFVDSTQVTTGVDPTTATGTYTVPVQVRNGASSVSNALLFTFTEAPPPPPPPEDNPEVDAHAVE